MDGGLVFIVDLNELRDGDLLPVSMDYTLNHGPRVRAGDPVPRPGAGVRVHSDDDDTLYHAEVIEVIDSRDLVVRINWDSCAPVLNREWSARTEPLWYEVAAATRAG